MSERCDDQHTSAWCSLVALHCNAPISSAVGEKIVANDGFSSDLDTGVAGVPDSVSLHNVVRLAYHVRRRYQNKAMER